jgi:hypothetical protein
MEDSEKYINNKKLIDLLLKTDIKYSIMRNCVNELIKQNKKILKKNFK